MATIVLGAAGAAVGGALGGGVLGLSSVVIGRAVGATLGRVVDTALLGAGAEPVETGRVDRFRLTSAGEGRAVPQVFGRMRVPGHVIWASNFVERVERSGGGGKGGPKRPETRDYSYSVSLAVGLCEGVIAGIGRIWADGREIDRHLLDYRVYRGGTRQRPDPVMEAIEGAGNVPAYRGIAFIVLENLELAQFGNRVPQFSFEVIRQEEDLSVDRDMVRHVTGVALLPGTGEYTLATTPVRYDYGDDSAFANVNSSLAPTDFTASLDALTDELPRCGAASLVVSWFGDDLRVGRCTVKPKVEQYHDGIEMPWQAGGIVRSEAELVPFQDGGAVYGGTPSDQSVLESIAALNARGQAVMFYPFVLMTQLAGNGLRDPHTGANDQPALPWRGRITTEIAHGRTGSSWGTAAVGNEVAAFFGQARPSDFAWVDGRVAYSGPAEWSYRRFILHYAHLCAGAGLDSFCVGSELRGITWIRDDSHFPAVQELRRLAAECRAILGPSVKISYAADWSEYFGYHPQDGSGDVYFHLDPFWADANVDFIGIDNYMRLSDWRDCEDQADAAWGSIYNLDYLKANITGGEGHDWYYASDMDRNRQVRTPITDGAYGEDWTFRYKDLEGWWSHRHRDRIGGAKVGVDTDWVPRSKPIWFTELGCAAIDKGTNQPNKFLDPKSSESKLPYHSRGQRDDFIQVQYLRAMSEFWAEGVNNPISPLYGERMVDMGRAFVWAWDMRPYPAFPGRADLWSDVANYDRGHWINGRASSRTLASTVREICVRSGVTEFDVDGLWGVVRGYDIDQLGDARAALQPLMLAHGFDAIERGGQLIFRSRTARVTATLDPGEVAAFDEIPGDIEKTRTPEAERTGRVKLTYLEADGTFEVRGTEAIRPDERGFAVSQSEVSLVLTDAEARAITERWLAETRIARDRVRFALPPSRLDLGAGDVVGLAGDRWRIDRVEQAELQVIEAVRTEPQAYELGYLYEARAPKARKRVAQVPARLTLLDLPLLRGDEAPEAPRLAVSARNWSGPRVIYAATDDAGYAVEAEVTRPATMGRTLTPLPAAEAGRFDNGPALEVSLLNGSLESVSEARLLAGANTMAIGRDGVWEVFQFRDAVLVGPDRWALTGRLRGQAGTDGVMPPVWAAGAEVVLIDDAVGQADLPPSALGVARDYLVAPSGRPLDDPAVTRASGAATGVGLRPYRPVHLRADAEAVTWIRRTRVGGDSWQGLDVPLGEERELYVVRAVSGGAVRREEMVERPAWTYSAAARAADGAHGAVTVEVAQVSASYGAGPAARITI